MVHFDVIFGIDGDAGDYFIFIKTVFSADHGCFFLTRVLQQAMCDIRNAFAEKDSAAAGAFIFDDHAFGDVLSCVTNDVDTLSNALQETLQRVLAAILTFIFVIGMMFYIHTILACTSDFDHSAVTDRDPVFCNEITEIV